MVKIKSETQKQQPLTFPVSLRELDLDLPSTDPFPVQVMKSVFGIADILERANAVKAFHFKHTDTQANHMNKLRSQRTPCLFQQLNETLLR